jgi:hypothetical protein
VDIFAKLCLKRVRRFPVACAQAVRLVEINLSLDLSRRNVSEALSTGVLEISLSELKCLLPFVLPFVLQSRVSCGLVVKGRSHSRQDFD